MKQKHKVVFDTNIYISAILFGGNPRTCFELARKQEIQLFTSKKILFEFSGKLSGKFKWSKEEVIDVIEGLAKVVKVVEPKNKVSVITKDPSDNIILECALEAKADFIITGDTKHILTLKKFKNIKIVTAKDFLDLYFE